MASVVSPARVSSASKVTLLADGIRPLMVMAPRCKSSSASLDNMAVAARTDVAARLPGLAARRADGPAGLREGAHPLHERRRLGARDVKARDGGLLFRFLFEELPRFQHDPVAVLIVAHAEGGDGPGGVHGLEQRRVAGLLAGAGRELGQEPPQVLTERADLLLLALEGEELPGLARLQIEHALPRRPHRAHREVIGSVELERVAHWTTVPAEAIGRRSGVLARAALTGAPARQCRRPSR